LFVDPLFAVFFFLVSFHFSFLLFFFLRGHPSHLVWRDAQKEKWVDNSSARRERSLAARLTALLAQGVRGATSVQATKMEGKEKTERGRT
jgi:hypothetical protein